MKKLFVVLSLFAATAMFAADSNLDVAKIIAKSDAESVLGTAVKDPSPVNVSGQDGFYSKVNYYSAKPGKTLIVRVRQAADGTTTPQQEFDLVAASGGTLKPVNELGEKAGVFNGSAQNGLVKDALMLYVVKGNAFVTVGVGGVTDEKAALEKAKTVARKLLAQL